MDHQPTHPNLGSQAQTNHYYPLPTHTCLGITIPHTHPASAHSLRIGKCDCSPRWGKLAVTCPLFEAQEIACIAKCSVIELLSCIWQDNQAFVSQQLLLLPLSRPFKQLLLLILFYWWMCFPIHLCKHAYLQPIELCAIWASVLHYLQNNSHKASNLTGSIISKIVSHQFCQSIAEIDTLTKGLQMRVKFLVSELLVTSVVVAKLWRFCRAFECSSITTQRPFTRRCKKSSVRVCWVVLVVLLLMLAPFKHSTTLHTQSCLCNSMHNPPLSQMQDSPKEW